MLFLDHIQEILVDPRVLVQLRVERGDELFALAGSDDMSVVAGKHIDALAYLCDVRSADEGHRHVAYPFELLVDEEATELPAVGVPQHGDVHGGDSFPRVVLHLLRQKDHAGAGAEGGQTVGDVLTDREEQFFVLHDPEHRGALSAGEDHAVFRLLPVAQFPYQECLHM